MTKYLLCLPFFLVSFKWLKILSDKIGLRGRLLVGLSLVGLTLTFSVGFVALWTTERQLMLMQQQTAAHMADLAASFVSASLALDPRGLKHPLVRRTVASAMNRMAGAPGAIQIAVIDGRSTRIVLGDGRGVLPAEKDVTLSATLRSPDVPFRRVNRKPSNPRKEGIDFVLYRRVSAGRSAAALRLVYQVDASVERLMRRARISVWVLGACDVFLLLLLAGVFLTRSILKPLRDLEEAARKVAGGDLSPRIASRGEAEIGRLAGAFNAMTERLDENEKTSKIQISRLEQQQRELDASWDLVIRAEKFASLGRLAAGVAHEVGNPLTALVGYVEMLKEGGVPEEEQNGLFDRMDNELRRMDTIIRGLLDYSRLQKEPVGPSELLPIIRIAGNLIKPERKMRDVDIRIEIPPDLPQVVVSSNQLAQVFVNLFLNSADAMNGKGQILVTARTDDLKPDHVVIEVSDTGPGVPQAIRDKVFDPFFTTKDVGRGTGLGLAISQSILQSMRGSITLGPEEPGNGATFLISLRSSPSSPSADEAKNEEAERKK